MEKSSKSSKLTQENFEESARLKTLYQAARHGLSQEAFGAKYDIGNQGAVWQCLNGKGMPISMKAAIGFARGLGCDIADFSPRLAAEAAAAAAVSPQESSEESVAIRHMAVKFSNGHGRAVFDEEENPSLFFRPDFIRKLGMYVKDAVLVDADGDSNYPVIHSGGVVLVDRGDTEIKDGKLYAFRCGGDLLIKRLTRLPDGSILAISENSTYPPRVLKEDDDFEIIGRTRWTCHSI